MGIYIKFWLRAGLIVLAGCWVLLPVLHGPWIWDDDLYITQNALLHTADGLRRIWVSPTGVNYFPLTFTLQWFEWHLWGENTVGYHAISIGLQLLSCFLLWRLLFKLGVREAWLGGLIFAVHPLTVESVAWVSELKNTLSLPFLLLATLGWMKYDEEGQTSSPSPYYYLISLALFVLSMLSKSTVVMFPFFLLLYAWWKRGRVGRSDLVVCGPFFAVSLGLGLLTVWFEHHRAMGGADLVAPGGVPFRVAQAGIAVCFYFFKCVAPVSLSLIYPPWTFGPVWLDGLGCWLLVGAAVFALIVGPASGHSTARKAAALGLGWFGLNLVPILGIIPIAYAHISWVADHFAYVPLVGIAGLAAAAASRHLPVRSALIGAIIACLAIGGHRYAAVFGDGEALWEHTLRRSPDSAVAHNNLGLVLAGEGRLPEAIAEYREALRLQPNYAAVEVNLGLALASSGRTEEAIDCYRDALRLNSGLPEVYNNLSILFRQSGRISEAIAAGEEALRLRPDYAEADNNLGAALIQAGRAGDAVISLDRAVELQPGFAEAHDNLGLALLLAGRLPEATAQEREAVRLAPRSFMAHYSLGLVLATAGRLPDAVTEFGMAVNLNPDFAPARQELERLQPALGQ